MLVSCRDEAANLCGHYVSLAAQCEPLGVNRAAATDFCVQTMRGGGEQDLDVIRHYKRAVVCAKDAETCDAYTMCKAL